MDRIEKAMQQAKASLRISGLEITQELEELVRAVLAGAISEEEFQKQALALARNHK
ncbi:antitoxin VbhA family protein [Ectobacillus ponti]|uniref:Antitoxin VbhA family protein n=1 Tax=Ectobacillus ponti TaxID=2961894 RepID=A0AA41XAL2_9BACI|nr:antitoxin VbhA family protein [Ectobacillus ponti]MCP8969965.1 antitoxin VbhA family protein [Ectobacillus ponti]